MFRTPTKKSGSGSKFSPSPSSPFVHCFGFLCTSTSPAWANASVTIANAIPPTRRLTEPSTSGSASATTATKPNVCHIPHSHFVSAMFVT